MLIVVLKYFKMYKTSDEYVVLSLLKNPQKSGAVLNQYFTRSPSQLYVQVRNTIYK